MTDTLNDCLNDPKVRDEIASRIESNYFKVLETMRDRTYKFADIALSVIKEKTNGK